MISLSLIAQTHSESSNLLGQFGWNLPFFIAQVVNFFLVILVLKKFAFGPIQGMLEQRSQRIAEGEAKLKQIEQQLAESEQYTAAAIEKANAEAQRLVDEAKESAINLSEQKAQEAIAAAQKILANAEAAAKAERAQIAAELKSEFGRLVAATATQATGGVLTAEQQKSINDQALSAVEA